jgi:hypothetical protein
MVVFLKAHRVHKVPSAFLSPSFLAGLLTGCTTQELVERYNPTNGMTNDERSRMSAKMVGLDYPEPFEEGVTPTMEGARAKKMKGSLQGLG